MEAWIKPTSLPSSGVFRSVMTKAESYALQFNGPRLEFTIIQSGTRRRLQTPAGVIVAGGTYHVVGTFDGSTQRLYVNGVQVASAALSGTATVTTNPIAIGSWDGTQEYFNGTLDEPAVYGTTLSAAQVRAHYDAAQTAALNAPSGLTASTRSISQVDLNWFDNSVGETGEVLERSTDAAFTSPTTITLAANQQSYSDTGLAAGTTYWYRVKAVSGATSSSYSNVVQATTPAPASYFASVVADHPISYWRLGETSGTIAGDITVANPGTYNGPPTLGAPSLVGTDQVDHAVGFNGTNNDVRVGQSGSLDLSTAITLEAFIKPSSLPPAGSFRSIVAKTGAYALALNGPTLELTILQLGVNRRLMAPAGTIAAGGTYHVVGTYDGTTERLYVNGRQVASSALTGAADVTISGVRIGSWDGAQQFFAGTIDEAAIYNKTLSAAQVAAHFSAAQTPLGAPSGLAATPVSASQIDLAWADNAGAETGQVLQRSTDVAFTSPTTLPLGANVQSYSDTGLAAGTTYWYRIRAVDASNESAWSPVASATTQAAPPPTSYASVVGADRPVGWWRLGETFRDDGREPGRRQRRHLRRRRDAQPDLAAGDRRDQQGGRVQRQHGPRVGALLGRAAVQKRVLAGGLDQADEPALLGRLPLGHDEGGVLLAAVQRPQTRVHDHPERHAPPSADADGHDRRRRHLPRRRHVRRHDAAPLRQRQTGRLRRALRRRHDELERAVRRLVGRIQRVLHRHGRRSRGLRHRAERDAGRRAPQSRHDRLTKRSVACARMGAPRVLLIEEGGVGGVADYTAELAAALARAGCRVDVATASDHRYPPASGVTLHGRFPYMRDRTALGRAIRRARLSKVVNGLTHLAANVGLLRLVRAADVVHVQGGEWPPLGALQALLVRAARRPLVWTPHNTFDRGERAYARSRALTDRCAARLVIHAEHDRGALPASTAAKAVVIPHGEYGGLARRGAPDADPDAARSELGAGGDELVVLLFGQLRPDKGVRDLLLAAAEVPEVHVVLAGEDKGALAEVADLRADARLAGRLVVREGFVPAEEAGRLFAAADVAALPYRQASASGVLLLACGYACPAVAYPVGGLPEYVVDGETGWLCARADPDALAEQLRGIATGGREACRARGAAARALADERFSWDAIAGQTAALYAQASGRAPA